MDQEFYSTKQMADLLGVSKQRVYRCIKTMHIAEAYRDTVKGNTVLMYTNADFMRIKAILNGDTVSDEAHHDTVNEALYEALLKQLDILNEQLKMKDAQIETLQMLLDQEQQLNAMHQQKILSLESHQKVAEEESENPETPKGFWARLFGK